MRVAGTNVPASAVAEVALRLHYAGENNLGQHLGTAVDTNRHELGLSVGARETILRVLEDCPDRLAELRDALLQEHT
jgi:hypothetical protein